MNARPDPNFHVSCRSSSKRARRAAALARRSGRSARRNAAHSAMPKGGSSDLDELLASRANDPQVCHDARAVHLDETGVLAKGLHQRAALRECPGRQAIVGEQREHAGRLGAVDLSAPYPRQPLNGVWHRCSDGSRDDQGTTSSVRRITEFSSYCAQPRNTRFTALASAVNLELKTCAHP